MTARATALRRSVLVALALVFIAGASVFAALRADRALRADLLQQGQLVAASICPDRVAALTGTPDDLGSPAYLHFKRRLAKIRAALPDCRFAYLMARQPDGTVVFLVDNEPDGSPDGSPPGQAYTNLTPELRSVLEESRAVVEGPHPDPWGTWVSALVPVAVSDSDRPVLVGLDVDARRWKWIVASSATLPAGLTAVAILLGLLAVELFGSRRELRRRKSELEASERRLLDLAAQSRTVAWEIDAAGLYTYVSPVAETVFGYRPDELVGKMHFHDLHPEEGREAFRQSLIAAFARREPFVDFENVVQTKGGQIGWVSTNAIPVLDRDGNLRGYRGNDMDVTARRKAQDELRASEAQKKTILDRIPANVALLDRNYRVRWANQTAAVSAGRRPEEMVGQPCHVFWGDPAKPCADCPAAEAFRTRRDHQKIVRTPDGRVWDESAVPLLDDAGALVAVVEIALDITERTRAEERMRALLEESNQARQALLGILEDHERAEADLKRLATAIEQSADSIVVADPRAAIQYVNPAFETVTGYRRAEVLGQNPRLLHSGQQNAAFYQAMWATLASGKTWRGRIVNRRKDGTLYTEDALISPVTDAAGQTINYVAVKRDVTEELRLAAQLNQIQKMESIGRLAGGVAHDFNNMLTIILGHAEMILLRKHLDPDLRNHLEEVQRAALDSAAIVRQLQAFARKQTIAPRIIDLNPEVGGAIQMLQRLIGEDVQLAWRPSAALWPVKVDPAQVDQMLVNLCVNARDAIAGVGQIAIETDNAVLDADFCATHPGAFPGEYARLTVRDTGCGMDPETLGHVFEPFYTTKAPGKGTGLGLAMVYGVVKQNGGYIDVASAEGQGTVVQIYLPRHGDEVASAPPAVPDAPPATDRKTILLVEDEPSILALTAEVLNNLGYAVRAAHSPVEAIRLAKEHPGEIHLLLTDVVMPGMNGRDLARTLQNLRPGLRFLFMSGYTADVIAHNGLLDEGLHFIHKPFTKAALAVKIREALEA
ncbi:MAG: PAS domain S-box protein [Kiritimatiellia bacterium]